MPGIRAFCVALVVMLLIQKSFSAKHINSFAGPYTAYVKKMYMCDPGNPTSYHWYVRASHFNPARPKELQRITGNVSFRASLDDHMWARAVLDARSNNQWKENAFVFRFDDKACTTLMTFIPDPYRVIAGGMPCPLTTNFTNEFVDEPVSWVFPQVPVMPYGNWRFRLLSGLKSVTRLCWVVECSTIPIV